MKRSTVKKRFLRRNSRIACACLILAAVPAWAQERGQSRQRIDVQSYLIDATINPANQTLAATALVRFTPLDDTSTVTFELNNALNLSKVMDGDGRQIPASRTQTDMTVRVTLPQVLPKGKVTALTFIYDGKLTGAEESPVFGIKFAAIHPDYTYLMYPARWFPVNDYTTDRFTSDVKVTVPEGFKVIASGLDSNVSAPAGMSSTEFKFDKASFPGSLAVVRGEAKAVSANGITTFLYLRTSPDMADAYGQEVARAMVYFSDVYGLPPKKNLTVVETEDGAPNGYSAPGVLFFAPRSMGKQVNLKLVANQVSRQWWGTLVSPTTRNHMWIENGLARYAEFLYEEHVNGAGALETEVNDTFV